MGHFRRRIRLKFMPLEPLQTQIPPSGIDGNDQRNLLNSQPALDFFLAFNCTVYILEALEVNETVDLVLCGKPRSTSHLVLAHTSNEAIRDAGIERLRPICDDVNEVRLRRTHTDSPGLSVAQSTSPSL